MHVNIGKAFTYGKNFDKKYGAAATLISNQKLALSKNTPRLFSS